MKNKKMKRYSVLFDISKCGMVEVKANSKDEARKKFISGDNEGDIEESEGDGEINFDDLEIEEIKESSEESD